MINAKCNIVFFLKVDLFFKSESKKQVNTKKIIDLKGRLLCYIGLSPFKIRNAREIKLKKSRLRVHEKDLDKYHFIFIGL